jgi:hypothetical protein
LIHIGIGIRDEVEKKPSTTPSTEKSNCSPVSRKRQLDKSSVEGTAMCKSEEEQSPRKRRSGTGTATVACVNLSSSDDDDSVHHSKLILRSKSGRIEVEGINIDKLSRADSIEEQNRHFVEGSREIHGENKREDIDDWRFVLI